ncbi:endonuclease [Candidatus Methylacidiphilum infernorum]|uniref:Endonuclease n=1 Tax=Candidatus Methylacidiphilum infernorum TaxID=511746 RepID=A0ABX7PV45_9BACT|nr:endonuclease [Candidatus Methylacidiphilum infernorum]QSR86857.1 endonuclease [Candidatus Methylacidiphilum infernorum]
MSEPDERKLTYFSYKVVKVKCIDPKEKERLREEFKEVKKKYLKYLAENKRESLLQWGFTEKDIDTYLKHGELPKGCDWSVDHRIPLFLSGNLENPNSFDNLDLLPNPLHKLKTKHIDDKYRNCLDKLSDHYPGFPKNGKAVGLDYPSVTFSSKDLSKIENIGQELSILYEKIIKPTLDTLQKLVQEAKKIEGITKSLREKGYLKGLMGWLGGLLSIWGIGQEVQAAVREGKETGRWGLALGKAGGRIGFSYGTSMLGGIGGAAIGSLFLPGIGTVAGGIVGGLFGGYAGQQLSELLSEGMEKVTLSSPFHPRGLGEEAHAQGIQERFKSPSQEKIEKTAWEREKPADNLLGEAAKGVEKKIEQPEKEGGQEDPTFGFVKRATGKSVELGVSLGFPTAVTPLQAVMKLKEELGGGRKEGKRLELDRLDGCGLLQVGGRRLADLKTIEKTKAVAKQRLEQAVLSASDPEKMDHEKLKAFLEKNNKRIKDKDWTGLAQRIEKVVEQKKAEDIPAYWKLPGIGKGKGPLFPESFWQKACEAKKRVEELEKQREEAPLFKAEGLTPNPFPGLYHSPIPELEQKKIREKIR